MLSYKKTKFTDNLIKEIITTVSRSTDDDVLTYIRLHKDLAKGFQIKKNGCSVFRKKISQYIITLHELDEDSARFLYRSGIGQEFVTVLSQAVLMFHLDEFAAIFGHDAFALALLLDERAGVHRLGRKLLETPVESVLDKEAACTVVADNLRNFTTHFSSICPGLKIDKDPSVENKEKVALLERHLKAEQKRNSEISERLQQEKQAALQQVADKKERITRLTDENHALLSTCSDLKRQVGDLTKQIEQQKSTFDATVTASVESRLQGLAKRWLNNSILVEKAVERKDSANDLLSKTENAIALQIRADRHTGNRRELQQRLSIISSKLAEVRDVLANALHPIDELREIENQLADEELNLSRQLGTDQENSRSPLVQALAARINAADNGENLHNIEQFLDELHRIGLVEADYCFLQNKLGDRYDRLLSENEGGLLPQMPLNPALRFRYTLGQGTPLTLVCDGHNILNSMDVFREVRNRNHAEARKSLSDSITGLLRPYQDCSATIVYDGPDNNRVECSDNVTVIYSGGGKSEKHRADRRIEELLNWRVYTGKTAPVYVVTADNELSREARESGAEVIPLEQFEWMLAW